MVIRALSAAGSGRSGGCGTLAFSRARPRCSADLSAAWASPAAEALRLRRQCSRGSDQRPALGRAHGCAVPAMTLDLYGNLYPDEMDRWVVRLSERAVANLWPPDVNEEAGEAGW